MIIAIVGAESTGKTQLAAALADRLESATGLPCVAVPEWLRRWCEREGRTPRADEQREIAETYARQLLEAEAEAAGGGAPALVIADTTPLMTAIYSELLFDDRSLHAAALEFHRLHCAATLVTALDLPWVADGLQRDGPQVRAPVDALLRKALAEGGIDWSLIAGSGDARVEAALDAVTPLLLRADTPRRGLFTRLQADDGALRAWGSVCEHCDLPECEHLLVTRAQPGTASRTQ